MRKSDVLKHFGGVRPTARALTAAGYPCSPAWVSEWPDDKEHKDNHVPELMARRIASMTQGRIPLIERVYRQVPEEA